MSSKGLATDLDRATLATKADAAEGSPDAKTTQ